MTRLIFPILCLYSFVFLSAQDNCGTFYPFKKGTLLEYTHYDGKGKVNSSTVHSITWIEDMEGGGISARVEAVIKDKKGQETNKMDFKVICKDDVISMQLTSTLAPELTNAFQNMEVNVSGDDLQIPGKLTVGQTLPNATAQVSAGSSGLKLINFNFEVRNRKVEAKESITTTAGTFECYKISSETFVKTIFSKTVQSVDWYAEGLGVVRSEYYDKKGNLDGHMELTKLVKP